MKKKNSFFKNFWVWILFLISCVFFSWIAFHFYPKAFPSVDLKIKMDRTTAMKSALELASQYHWGPKDYRQAVNFHSNSMTQTFIELSPGGSQLLKDIVNEGIYAPYTWRVRHFKEGSAQETNIFFTPKGKLYGFYEHLPENSPGAALSQEKALKIAESSAKRHWGVLLKNYDLVEKSFETRLSSRIDHTFVYELKNKKIGEGKYRLKLTVNGDQLSGLSHFIKVPESFTRKYSEMRSFNNLLSQSATIVMFIFYLFIGCGIGLFFLAKKRWIIWKTPMICALVVISIQFLENLNQFPLFWIGYDTALSSSSFIIQIFIQSFSHAVYEFVLLSLSFIAAESLSRKAWPKHPLLWNIWKPQVASSYEILGRTLGGYVGLGFFMALSVMTYYIGRHYFGWWNPSDILFHPDNLASFFPWFTSIAHSLHAGFWEEALFRAIPLSGAALLGARFGKKNLWITSAFILQALVFAAAHANYPTQPYYARLIELILPSFVFGGIYLFFGLLPGIILHFIFDVAAFSIPIFTADTPLIWIDRSLIILFSLIPLWIVLYSRFKVGKWSHLKSTDFNQGWYPEKITSQKKIIQIKAPRFSSSKCLEMTFCLLAMILFYFWVVDSKKEIKIHSLSVSEQRATQIAQKALQDEGYHLSPEWEMHRIVTMSDHQSHEFIWKEENKDLYIKLFGNYLSPPVWSFRWLRFDRDVTERSEEYHVSLSENGKVFYVGHSLPEGRPGAQINESQAKQLALNTIQQKIGLLQKNLKDASINSTQNPSRKDWLVQFTDPSIHLKTGEARIAASINGDQPSGLSQYINVPEEWSRNNRNNKSLFYSVSSIGWIVLFCFGISALFYCVYQWVHHQFDKKSFFLSSAFFMFIGIFNIFNSSKEWLYYFSTSQPKMNQIMSHLGGGVTKSILFSLCIALGVGLFFHESKNSVKILRRSAWALGLSAGSIYLTLGIWIQKIFPDPIPFIGDFSPLNLVFPKLAFLNRIFDYICKILILFFFSLFLNKITNRWSTKKILGGIYTLMIGISLCATSTDSFGPWIAGSIFCSLTLFFLYYYIMNPAYSMCCIIALVWTIMNDLKNIVSGYFPDTSVPFAINMIVITCISIFIFEKIQKRAEYKSDLSDANR